MSKAFCALGPENLLNISNIVFAEPPKRFSPGITPGKEAPDDMAEENASIANFSGAGMFCEIIPDGDILSGSLIPKGVSIIIVMFGNLSCPNKELSY